MDNKWQPGWIPAGWSRGEHLGNEKPTGRFRGSLEICVDVAGFPVVPRSPGTKVAIEYGAHEEYLVADWLQWWKGAEPAEYADYVSIEGVAHV